jgi:hypothetical protein
MLQMHCCIISTSCIFSSSLSSVVGILFWLFVLDMLHAVQEVIGQWMLNNKSGGKLEA